MAFDFGRANQAQRRAIETTDGPLLITAGPGTGKTFTLVQRAIYLIEERIVKAKAEAATEIATASNINYIMYAGTRLMNTNVLSGPTLCDSLGEADQ